MVDPSTGAASGVSGGALKWSLKPRTTAGTPDLARVRKKLQDLIDLGLDYLTLGALSADTIVAAVRAARR